MSDTLLTQKVKACAFQAGADLVGIAPVSRWARAPVEHSPQGILPTARSAVVCAVHLPDACVERGGEPDPRVPGPALVLASVSGMLNEIAFDVARFLDAQGWEAIAIPITGLWVYRPQPGAARGWMADLCHYYAAAAAGLGEIGWHNLCITPEFGSRQRFVTVVTNAELEPTPLYRGEPLCDRCLLCAKACPTHSFEKEVSGMAAIEIEDRRFEFPRRNLWRCGIGENFQLDVFLPWDEPITEALIAQRAYEAVTTHPEWIKGWKMGMCLKYCVNPQRRYFDKRYCRSPRRRRDVEPNVTAPHVARVMQEVLRMALTDGADFVASGGLEQLQAAGLDARAELPDAAGAILLGAGYPERCELRSGALLAFTELRIANALERLGFSVMTHSGISAEAAAVALGVAERQADGRVVTPRFGSRQHFRLMLTSMPTPPLAHLPATGPRPAVPSPAALTARLKAEALAAGADLIRIAPVERLDALVEQLRPIAAAEQNYFVVRDQGWTPRGVNIWGGQALPYNPQAKPVQLQPRRPADYLPSARSVIVVAQRLFRATVEHAARGPGKKVAHYQLHVHGLAADRAADALLRVAKVLDNFGLQACPTADLTGLASTEYGFGNPDLTANRFAALAAGFGDLGLSGVVLTPEFGPRQRFMALVTDAELIPDPVYGGAVLCRRCARCIAACPVAALDGERRQTVTIEGRRFEWAVCDRLRCDWAKRYGLVGEEGPKYMGSQTDIPPPKHITPEAVCEAMRRSDRIQRPGYSAIVERCFTECPLGSVGANVPRSRGG